MKLAIARKMVPATSRRSDIDIAPRRTRITAAPLAGAAGAVSSVSCGSLDGSDNLTHRCLKAALDEGGVRTSHIIGPFDGQLQAVRGLAARRRSLVGRLW